MISSALITRRPEGTGIEVDIITPLNIIRVTETQYANAMITAGVTDALVQIVAPVAVTGEAALTGIFKAFYERGYELDEERMQIGQEQLEIVVDIANNLRDDENFNSHYLDQTIIDIQVELAEIYNETGQLATDQQILDIINNALDNNNLEDILSEQQIQRLAGFAERFQLSDAINSEEFRNQLSNLANRVGNLIDNVDRGTVRMWWDRLVEIVRGFLQ
jgi:uncharacterized protein YpuA (DUF1002 family)